MVITGEQTLLRSQEWIGISSRIWYRDLTQQWEFLTVMPDSGPDWKGYVGKDPTSSCAAPCTFEERPDFCRSMYS